jgi:bifunctional non-homologous end joining protein LigD
VGLLVGQLDERGVLRYRGRVELGVTEEFVMALQERLGSFVRPTSPFVERIGEPDATYVEPRVPVEIPYLERTSQGRLRHAAFRQLGGRWSH